MSEARSSRMGGALSLFLFNSPRVAVQVGEEKSE